MSGIIGASQFNTEFPAVSFADSPYSRLQLLTVRPLNGTKTTFTPVPSVDPLPPVTKSVASSVLFSPTLRVNGSVDVE